MRTMTYQEWLALCESAPDAANARCAKAMGWKLGRDGMHWYCGKDVKNDICNWLPITDRNHAAMMVEKAIERGKQGIIEASLEAFGYSRAESVVAPVAVHAWAAYCALAVLEKEGM